MQPLPQSEDAPVEERRWGRGRVLAAGVAILVCGTALGAIIALAATRKARSSEDEFEVFGVVTLEEEQEGESMLHKCVNDADALHEITNDMFDWRPLSAIDPNSKEAIAHAISLLNDERKSCEGEALPELPFTAEEFEQGGGHRHRVHVHHKYAHGCVGSAFKLHFYTDSTAEESMSFVVHIYRDAKNLAWTVLKSSPSVCDIKLGDGGFPETLEPWSKQSQEKAKFVATELTYQMKREKCLEPSDMLQVEKIEQVRTTIDQGVLFEMWMTLKLSRSDKPPFRAKLFVLEVCGVVPSEKCVNELRIPKPYENACAVMSGKEVRRLAGPSGQGLGHIRPDPTEVYLSKTALLAPGRFLTSERPPMELRQIKQGPIQGEYDPRGEECFEKIPVYDQGSCGSCYAQAVAQMIGIRKCRLDKKPSSASHRRLEASASERQTTNSSSPSSSAIARRLGGRETTKGCACLAQWSWHGNSCNTGCCNPDHAVDEWCFVEDTTCEGGANWGYCKPETPQPACADSKRWTDISGDGCDWYKENDNGCTTYKDYGQRTHCRVTCGTCPITENQDANANPWHNALFQYMPSVNDLAQCAIDEDGTIRGCDGGNAFVVWEGMRKSVRTLNRMGQACMPYTLKCWESQGVVNPLSGGECAAYTDYETWHKPCSCISSSLYPKAYTCPSAAPNSDCGIEIPAKAYLVSTIAHGLTNQQAVENIQRHIAEYGPVYIAFSVSSAFMSWNWRSKPVYTGGSDDVGGHAVMAVGWGALGGIDYWFIRNSWGSGWADRGYCRFKRGVNLDGIEEREVAALMPEGSVQDRSPPTCRLNTYSFRYMTMGSLLKSYEMTLKFTCSEKAVVEVYASHAGSSDKWSKYNTNAQAKQEFEVQISVGCLGYGLQDTNMIVTTTATDADGNAGNTRNSLIIKKVNKVQRVAPCR